MNRFIQLSAKLVLGVFAFIAFSEMAVAQDQPATAPLTVVELFQSQGCSSCPPAEANLNAIAGEPNVLALSYGVTYWDSLGWKDTFATQAYTDRQYDYAHYHHRSGVFTPQVYIDGQRDLVGSDRAQLEQMIAQSRTQGPSLAWNRGQLLVGAGNPSLPADVWLVRYDPRTLNVAIAAGENSGRTLPHRNVVREFVHLARGMASRDPSRYQRRRCRASPRRHWSRYRPAVRSSARRGRLLRWGRQHHAEHGVRAASAFAPAPSHPQPARRQALLRQYRTCRQR